MMKDNEGKFSAEAKAPVDPKEVAKKFEEGTRAQKAGQHDKAREALAAAFALVHQHIQVERGVAPLEHVVGDQPSGVTSTRIRIRSPGW